jgi:hypothetical protein
MEEGERQNQKGSIYFRIKLLMIINLLLGLTNRVLQLCYYCISNFEVQTVKKAALTFCILPSALNVFMMSLYCILHTEENLTPLDKFKKILLYVISMEFLFPVGVQMSLKSKYSYNADNPLITLRLVNAVHFMLVALPQILVVSINSSINDKFNGVDIASLVISCFFMVWSVGYYFLCIAYGDFYDEYISDIVEKSKSD